MSSCDALEFVAATRRENSTPDRSWSYQDIQTVYAMRAEGKEAKEIGLALGRTERAIYSLASRMKMPSVDPLRKDGMPKRKKGATIKYTTQTIGKIRDWRNDEVPYSVIAERLGILESSVRAVVSRYKIRAHHYIRQTSPNTEERIPCTCCKKMFTSWNRKLNKLCFKCAKEGE